MLVVGRSTGHEREQHFDLVILPQYQRHVGKFFSSGRRANKSHCELLRDTLTRAWTLIRLLLFHMSQCYVIKQMVNAHSVYY